MGAKKVIENWYKKAEKLREKYQIISSIFSSKSKSAVQSKMNKLLLISFLLLGVGIHSSTSSPFLNTLQSLATAVRNSGINQAVGVPVVAAAQTVTSNAGALVNTGSLAPASSAQVDSTVDGVTGLPGGVAEVVEDQVKQDQVKAFLDNTEAILQNFNTSNPLKTIYTGVKIGGGAHSNSVGALSLPTYSLCPLQIQYKLTSCFICNQDCYVAHNLWGGKCGKSPINGGDTCLCGKNETEAASRDISPHSTDTCKVYNPLGLFVDYLIGLSFRVRSIALQCRDTGNSTWDSSGCEVDCKENHGYTGGICNLQYPNVDNLQYSSQQKVLFCTCTDNNGTLSTTGRDSPLPVTTPTSIISSASSSSEEVSSSSSTDASASSTSSTSGY